MKLFGRTIVKSDGRILEDVPPHRLLQRGKEIKRELETYLDRDTCLDYCWIGERSHASAWEIVDQHPDWRFCDVMSFYRSIPHQRLWRMLNRLDYTTKLTWWVNRYYRECGVEMDAWDGQQRQYTDKFGIAEGCPCSPVIANLYLAEIDKRWAGRMVRLGDNFACADVERLRAELAGIGLHARLTEQFTSKRPPPQDKSPS